MKIHRNGRIMEIQMNGWSMRIYSREIDPVRCFFENGKITKVKNCWAKKCQIYIKSSQGNSYGFPAKSVIMQDNAI